MHSLYKDDPEMRRLMREAKRIKNKMKARRVRATDMGDGSDIHKWVRALS